MVRGDAKTQNASLIVIGRMLLLLTNSHVTDIVQRIKDSENVYAIVLGFFAELEQYIVGIAVVPHTSVTGGQMQ